MSERIRFLALAHTYEDAGLTVVPPAMDGSKKPLPASWKAFQSREPLSSELRDWYRGDEVTGIGTVCGAISGNLELFEFDDLDTYLAFCEAAEATGLGELVERVRQGYSERTPGNGIHWYYRCDTIAGNTKLASVPAPTEDNPHGVKVLIETRGEGGYSVMAPSCGRTHPTGNPYEVLAGKVANIAKIEPSDRAALWQLARSFDLMPAKREPIAPTPQVESGDRPGDLFNGRTSWAEVLEPHGWRRVFQRGTTTYWRRPGKDTGISATTGHTERDTFMCFSTSTPFETVPTSYTRFAAYAVLNHGGDFIAAGRELWQQGYREERKGVAVTLDWTRPAERTLETVDETTGEVHTELAGRVLVGDVIRNGVPAVNWIVEGVFFDRSVCLFYGKPGCGKTLLLLYYCLQLIHEGRKVVYVDQESGIRLVASRLRDMGADPDELDENFYYYPFTGITHEHAEELEAFVTAVGAEFVVFDSLGALLATAGLKENENSDIGLWMGALPVRIAERTNACVVLVDHITKDAVNTEYSVGGGAKKRFVDTQWVVTKTADFDATKVGRIKLEGSKNRLGNMPESHTYEAGGEGGMIVVRPAGGAFPGEAVSLSKNHQKVLGIVLANAGVSLRDIERLADVTHSTARRATDHLLELKRIERKEVNQTAIYHPPAHPAHFENEPAHEQGCSPCSPCSSPERDEQGSEQWAGGQDKRCEGCGKELSPVAVSSLCTWCHAARRRKEATDGDT